MPPRVALVHALRASMEPIEEAFAAHWPEAQQHHLLDDALPADLERAGRIDEAITERFVTLARYAAAAGADAVLFTCSAFGSAIDAARASLSVPVMKPNEAMLVDAVRRGGTVALVATFAPTLRSMLGEAEAAATSAGTRVRFRQVYVPGALAALAAGDVREHDARIVDAVATHAEGVDAIALTQFSMARAAPAIRRRVATRVHTTPDAAVIALRAIVGRPSDGSEM